MAKAEERQELWGAETTKAVENFPVSGEPIPARQLGWAIDRTLRIGGGSCEIGGSDTLEKLSASDAVAS